MKKYYGYTNKVTHTIMSQIDNDEMMRNCFMNDAVDMDLNNITLGQYIKDHFLDQKPTISKDSFTLDHYNESMLSWAYDMVNWEEIADHILDEVAEEDEPEEGVQYMLTGTAYAMVNWEEIAEHILDAVAEETE